MNSAITSSFSGTSNPRHLRAIDALMAGPLTREELDRVAGVSNGPQLVSDLRDLGLKLPCDRVRRINRDGRPCRPGVYRLNSVDRQKVEAWQRDCKDAWLLW